MKKIKNQSGISLVELLIGLVLGLFLTGGAVQTFMVTKTSYRFSDALARVQENGRFGLELISRDLRMTGFFGCASFSAANINDTIINPAGTGYNTLLYSFGTPLDGNDNTELNASDRLILKGAMDESYLLSAAAASSSADFVINIDNGITQSDVVAVGDCESIDIIQVTNNDADATGDVEHAVGTTNPGNLTASMSKVYGTDAHITPVSVVQYFIATGANGEPSLFRSVNGATPDELLSGVENMQILYGEDTDGDDTPNRFVDASSGTLDMNDVVSVRFSLLIRSFEDRVTEDPQVYTFNGATVTAGDNRIRQVFTSTVGLRNRLL